MLLQAKVLERTGLVEELAERRERFAAKMQGRQRAAILGTRYTPYFAQGASAKKTAPSAPRLPQRTLLALRPKLIATKIDATKVIAAATPKRICVAVAESFPVTLYALLSRSQRYRECRPRFAAIKLMRELCGMSFPQIGRALDRDHTTIQQGMRSADELFAEDPDWRARYEQALALLKSGAELSK